MQKRTFKSFPKEKNCPVCGTNTDTECTLVPIAGTEEGNIAEAECVHVSCILSRLILYPEERVIALQYEQHQTDTGKGDSNSKESPEEKHLEKKDEGIEKHKKAKKT